MSDRTGFCRGTLQPAIYFENSSGFVILPPEEIGVPGSAREVYERRYKSEGWEWREAGSLSDLDRLQKRLVDQETKKNTAWAQSAGAGRDEAFRRTGDALRARMVSSSTSPYERDFIEQYLKMRDEKRPKYQNALTEHNMYIWAREQNSNTRVEDRMPSQPGEFWRNEAQQK